MAMERWIPIHVFWSRSYVYARGSCALVNAIIFYDEEEGVQTRGSPVLSLTYREVLDCLAHISITALLLRSVWGSKQETAPQ